MEFGHPIKETIGIAVTAARYGIAEVMAHHVRDDGPIGSDLAIFIAADIADGVVLRYYEMDTPLRRIADGVVDHISVARVAAEVAKSNPSARPYTAFLAARATAVGGLNAVHLATTGEATKGNNHQRSTNLTMAAFALAAASRNKPLTHLTGVVATGVALATLSAHFRKLGQRHDGMLRYL